ncbi:hypothetical protein DFH29DRAFT_985620 [Suillus ampliporus]|nr:hypothetical protein DFH29DRAFT_985620 [Suillus ampliporus]
MLLTYNITDTILMKTSTCELKSPTPWLDELYIWMKQYTRGGGGSFLEVMRKEMCLWRMLESERDHQLQSIGFTPFASELDWRNDLEDKHIVHHCDPLEAIKTLLGNPAHAEHVVYRPKKIFSDASKSERIYNEMWTGNWWNTIQLSLQDRLPSGACAAPVIIATDKTQLTQFMAGKTAYLVKMVGKQLTKKQKSTRIQQLFHNSMRIVLEPLIEAGKKGMEVWIVYPILACYVADYPEQCLVTCAKYGTCPKCQVNDTEIGGREAAGWRTQHRTSKLISTFKNYAKQDNISGGVHHPFWENFPHCNIHTGITSDVLHQLYQGVVKHLEHWCTSLMMTAELDHHIRLLPPCFRVRHFKNGWSQLSQVSGKERKDMARILLGCIMGKAPSQVIVCYRALLDFIYVAQYPTHDDSTLQYLTKALDKFHANKDILVDLGIRYHFNIPKFHSMLHYEECIHNFGTTDNYNTEMFEQFHIDYAKEAWRASNFCNGLPQMTQWLSRQEKIVMFQSYISHYQLEEEREEEILLGMT